jgi:hypothetical protein
MLISCPECGAKVSDKAHVCPHCGFQIDTLVRCPDCGELVSLGTAKCPNCGYPFSPTGISSESSATPQIQSGPGSILGDSKPEPMVVAAQDVGQFQNGSVIPPQPSAIPNSPSNGNVTLSETKNSQSKSSVSYRKMGIWTIVYAVASILFSIIGLGKTSTSTKSIAIIGGILLLAPFLGLGIAILRVRPRTARILSWLSLLWWFVFFLLVMIVDPKDIAATGWLYGLFVLAFLMRTRHSN